MGAGADVVKAEILNAFDVTAITDYYNVNAMSTDIGFAAEGRNFVVRVSQEFDDDYGTGMLSVPIDHLGQILRSSPDGKATVRTTGISLGIPA